MSLVWLGSWLGIEDNTLPLGYRGVKHNHFHLYTVLSYAHLKHFNFLLLAISQLFTGHAVVYKM